MHSHTMSTTSFVKIFGGLFLFDVTNTFSVSFSIPKVLAFLVSLKTEGCVVGIQLHNVRSTFFGYRGTGKHVCDDLRHDSYSI